MCLGSMFSMLPDLQFARFLIWARNSSLSMNQVLGICISHSHMGNVNYELTNTTHSYLLCNATFTQAPPLPCPMRSSYHDASLLSPPCHPVASPFSQPYLLLLKDDTDSDTRVVEIVFDGDRRRESGKGSCIIQQ